MSAMDFWLAVRYRSRSFMQARGRMKALKIYYG